MSNSEEKSSKANGLGTDPMQRLASIKPPRDYTLGAANAKKKVFTPNLNVARNKNKGPATPNLTNQKRDDKKRDRKNDKNRNIKNGPAIIRGAGVFSEGAAQRERHASRSYGLEAANDSPNTLQRPLIRVKDVVTIDKELEEQKIKAMMGQDSSANEESEDFKKSLEHNAPIRLPMDDFGWSVKKPKAVQVKQEVLIKTEPGLDDIPPVVEKALPQIKKEIFEDSDVVDVLRSDQQSLILVKFPESLPGRVARPEDSPPRRKHDEPAAPTAPTDSAEPTQEYKCCLRGLEEGRVGTLRVHRSGRTTLQLGDVCFQVSLGTKSSYYQEVVSVAANDTSRSANLVSLGRLNHKFTVVPDWENMLLEIPS